MNSNGIRIISGGTPWNTKILTHEGHEISSCTKFTIDMTGESLAKGVFEFLVGELDIVINSEFLDKKTRNLLMHHHNVEELKRLGLSRIN